MGERQNYTTQAIEAVQRALGLGKPFTARQAALEYGVPEDLVIPESKGETHATPEAFFISRVAGQLGIMYKNEEVQRRQVANPTYGINGASMNVYQYLPNGKSFPKLNSQTTPL